MSIRIATCGDRSSETQDPECNVNFFFTSSYPGAVTTWNIRAMMSTFIGHYCTDHSVGAGKHQLPELPPVRDGDGLGVLHFDHRVPDHIVRDVVRDDPLDTAVSLETRNT